MKIRILITIFISFLFSATSFAEVIVQTPDGKSVLLKDNGTWEFCTPKTSNNSEGFQEMDLDDLKIDIKILANQKVKISAIGQYFGDTFMIKKEMMDMSPIIVSIEAIPREQRKAIVKSCGTGAPVIVFGRIGKVNFQDGIIADKVEVK